MQTAVARHEELVRAALTAHDGYLFKTLGDAFCVAFRTVPDALNAALAAQRALAREDFSAVGGLKVRMALHTGLAEERGGDYYGPTVNRVARLLSVGHGGQILLSGATADLALGELPVNSALRDLGAHRLKDLTHAQQVFQLVAADLPAEFPPLRSLDALPNNLPLQVTSFVGRDKDVAEVKELLHKTRLLTLAGPGGVGKTRLALQVAAEVLDQFPDGVWVVEFADLSDPDLVSAETAAVLSVGIASNRSLVDAIVYSLKLKRSLLIFDNCEHLVKPITELASAVIHGAPNVRVLATSREVFGTAGEIVYRVSSLALPPPQEDMTANAAAQYGAISLFVDRATAANTRFVLTDADAPIVADICRRLDGIAFAIELAAARLKAMSVTSLAERLNQRFRLLTGGDRTGLQRQQTMRALIDWSYNLLTAEEQQLLCRMAVFAGGWTLEAAEAVCVGPETDVFDILDFLSSLVDKSLVVADLSPAGDRYRLLDSIREYAIERLVESGERERLSRLHAEYYLEFALKADDAWDKTATLAWLAKLEPEVDNFRAALDWALTQRHDTTLGVELIAALGRFWYDSNLHVEGAAHIRAALAMLDAEGKSNTNTAASLWLHLAPLTDHDKRLEAAERAYVIYQELGDEFGAAKAQNRVAYGLYQLGRLQESESACRSAMPVLQKSSDSREVADCLNRLGVALWAQGRINDALPLINEALARAKKLGYDELMGAVLTNLGENDFGLGDAESALARANEVLTIDKRHRNSRNLAIDYGNITAYLIALRRYDEAKEAARAALRYAREGHREYYTAVLLQHFATIAAMSGRTMDAARITGFVEAAAGYEYRREPNEARMFEELMSTLRERLSEAELKDLMEQGRTLTEEQAVELASTDPGSK